MAVDQKISQLPEALTLAGEDVVPIVQVSTGLNKKVKVSTLLQDAGFVKDAVSKIAGETLEVDKINLVNVTIDTTFTLPTASLAYKGKVLIVKLDNNPNSNLTISGAAYGTVILTKFRDSVIFSCVETNASGAYDWFDVSKSVDLISQTITNGVTTKSPSEDAVSDALALKLDLDGGNANQDIDIDGFSLKAKHVKINGTAGAGHISLKHQSANITANANESSIGADSVGDPVWKNDGGAIDKLELQSNKTGTVTGNEASTSKYLTVKGVYDWAVGLFAPKASPTFTGTVTTPDIVVSSATGSTPAFFDAVDKLITTTAQLWGTWVQSWANKATPVDADTIGFYNSASTFVGVKSTLLNFWTTYLLPKIQALSYVSGSISSGYIPYFNGTSLVNSRIIHNYYTHSTAVLGSASYTQAFSVYNNAEVIPLLSILNDATSATFRVNSLFISSADNSRSIIIAPKGISGYSYKPTIYVATDSTNNQSTYTAYHTPTDTYTLVSNSAGQLMLFAINNTVGTLINAIHNKSSVQQGAWYNGGLLVGSGTKLASASLQVESTTQGFLPPRMTNTQRTNIVSPAIGLMVYCTDAIEGLYIYKSTGWTFII